MPSEFAPHPSSPADVTRAYRRRGVALSAALIVTSILIVASAAAAFSAVNVLRALDYGQAQWAVSQKSMAMALDRYIGTRSERDYRDFEAAFAQIEQARRGRESVEAGTVAWRDIAAGMLVHDEDNDMLAGYALFHRWPGFADANAEWSRADRLIAEVAGIARDLHALVASRAPKAELEQHFDRLDQLDRLLTRREKAYADAIDDASHSAMTLTLTLFIAIATLACGGGLVITLLILRTGMRAETRALTEEQRVLDFAEVASDWFCEVDRNRMVTYVSRRLSENAPNILVGQRWSLTKAFPGFTRHDTRIADAVSKAEAFRDVPLQETEPNGTIHHWAISGKPQFDADGTVAGYRVSARNVTHVVEALQQLARARDEAEAANRAKSAFLANMSHELRTPLNAILGFSELIGIQVQAGKGEARHGSYAHDIQTSGRHLLAIINDLLEHSRVEAGEMSLHIKPFEGAGAIEAVKTLCQPRADALGVTLRTEVPPGLPQVNGDELRFKQVLINIVTNAIKFSPEGEVTLSAHRDGQMLCLEVLDTGIGMDAAGIEQALKPFGQADSGLNRKYEGTGLGVPLAKALTELQGGRFAIASKPGAGTRVTITVPLAVEAIHELAVAAA